MLRLGCFSVSQSVLVSWMLKLQAMAKHSWLIYCQYWHGAFKSKASHDRECLDAKSFQVWVRSCFGGYGNLTSPVKEYHWVNSTLGMRINLEITQHSYVLSCQPRCSQGVELIRENFELNWCCYSCLDFPSMLLNYRGSSALPWNWLSPCRH